MSRLWDTPSFWARAEVDELLRDYPNTDVRKLAESFERSKGNYDGDPSFARDMLAELHKRIDAGIRFWPEPVELASIGNAIRQLMPAEGDDEPAYWWQRM